MLKIKDRIDELRQLISAGKGVKQVAHIMGASTPYIQYIAKQNGLKFNNTIQEFNNQLMMGAVEKVKNGSTVNRACEEFPHLAQRARNFCRTNDIKMPINGKFVSHRGETKIDINGLSLRDAALKYYNVATARLIAAHFAGASKNSVIGIWFRARRDGHLSERNYQGSN